MRHIRFLGLLLAVLSFWTITIHADIWSWGDSSTSSYNGDEEGYAYRGGVDFEPPAQSPLTIGYSSDMDLGCGGLDLVASFQHFLSGEAAQDYLSDLGESALAAAPMVLLEFASPTLADALKNFQKRAQDLLTLNQYSCEQITKAATSWSEELHAQGAKDKVDSTTSAADIPAIASAPETGAKDFFGDKKDYYLIADGMKWAQADTDTSSRAVNLCGDVFMPQEGDLKYTSPSFSLGKLFADYKSNYDVKLLDVILSFDSTRTVPDLKDVSLPTFPITPELLQSITDIDSTSGKRDLAIAKLSSAIALNRVSHEVDDILFNLAKFDSHPNLVNKAKEYLAAKEDYLRKAKGDLLATKENEDKTSERVAYGIISEYQTDRAKAVSIAATPYLENNTDEVFSNPFGFGGIAQ